MYCAEETVFDGDWTGDRIWGTDCCNARAGVDGELKTMDCVGRTTIIIGDGGWMTADGDCKVTVAVDDC